MWREYSFGAFKVPLPAGAPPKERIERRRAMLARALDSGSTVAVVGSGISRNLGYPSWPGFALGVVQATLEELEAKAPGSQAILSLRKFEVRLTESQAEPDPEILMFFIGACQEALNAARLKPSCLKLYYRKAFGPSGRSEVLINPFKALVDLPIQRFVTTNYDCEIERALARKLDIPKEAFGIGGAEGFKPVDGYPQPLSFTQENRFHEQLALFALGDEKSNRHMVFHCHGRYDRPRSVIASEQDYQRWYLSDKTEGAIFRKTIELLFRSNPLLFVGYGLGDDDLLQSLRMLGARRPEDKDEKAFFALMPLMGESDPDHHEYLYQRYGVHVIPFNRPGPGEDWASKTRETLLSCRAEWQDARRRWLSKPCFRKAQVKTRPPAVFRFPNIVEQTILDPSASPKYSKHVAEVESLLVAKDEMKVLALVGEASKKKTWIAHKVLDRLEKRPRCFESLFYWDAHNADDALHAIEKFVAYVEPRSVQPEMRKGSLLDRLCAAVGSGRHLLVLDGCERLLLREEKCMQVEARSPVAAALLRIIASAESHSTVLFISQWLPSVWLGDGSAPRVKKYEVSPLAVNDLVLIPPFTGLDEKKIAALTSLLNGHFYGLLLASRFLFRAKHDKADVDVELGKLVLEIGREPQGNRITTLLSKLIEALDQGSDRVVSKFIRRAGAFVSPVGRPTLDICCEQAIGTIPNLRERARRYGELVQLMINEGLMMRMRDDHSPGRDFYVAHPTVRGFLFDRYEYTHQGVLPDFGLGGYTARKALVWPESKAMHSAETELYDALLKRAQDLVCDEVPRKSRDLDEARELLRRSFSLIRSRMSAVATLNWNVYEYLFRSLLRLLVLVKKASPEVWMHAGQSRAVMVEHPDGVLYAADLAWLYNELGLCLESEGYATDAWLIWEQSHEINMLIEGPAEAEYLAEYELQSLLNLTQLAIDRCRLTLAEERLVRAEQVQSLVESDDLLGQLRGYRGLLALFRDDSKMAVACFREAIEMLERAGNRRALCFFLGHWASQEALLGHYEVAWEYLERALAIASVGQFRDLATYLELESLKAPSRHRVQDLESASTWVREDLSRRRLRLMAILRFINKKEMKKHEGATYSNLSKVSLEQGDFEGAREFALNAVAGANQLGLKSRQLRSLFGLARATYWSGGDEERQLGISYMRHVERLARRHQYWLLSREAREELHQWGVFLDGDEQLLQPEYQL